MGLNLWKECSVDQQGQSISNPCHALQKRETQRKKKTRHEKERENESEIDR